MKPSSEEFEHVVEQARDLIKDGYIGAVVVDAREFAKALVAAASTCMIGVRCPHHADMVHGQEAEELRTHIEQIVSSIASVEEHDAYDVLLSTRKALVFLLDRIDARDSLAFRQATDPPVPVTQPS